MLNIKRKTNGFTLLEMTVSMGIFSIVMIVTIGAFLLTIKAQRVALAEKAVAENVSFAMEFMSRQMRVVKRDSLGVCIDSNNTYQATGPEVLGVSLNIQTSVSARALDI